MIDHDTARQRAAAFLAERSRTWGASSRVRIVPEECVVDGGRLIAPYDHVGYLDEGREELRLAGNLPVRVDLATGECSFADPGEVDDLVGRGVLWPDD
ncbi:hypothetical protein [Streptomyces sp. JJ36]|uniref:hypothetical protein n=1 Tax=Streptomyces sp. JJ36 TaxID=2736645 RepID=UPI001F1F90F1|nr:hypothetical protein [Streptomyces sp. JJ36]MCF6521539.1 hypothetical protein [Streptomyces sp. JJ36]